MDPRDKPEKRSSEMDQVPSPRATGDDSAEWARSQDSLAIQFLPGTGGNHEKSHERAIEHFNQALKVWTREGFPEDWAATHFNLGIVYRDRIQGQRAGNIERAIEHFNQALKVWTREGFPDNWAATHFNLGIVYRDRIQGRRAGNIERAIGHFNQALEVWTREGFPENWAAIQYCLGSSYWNRQEDRTVSLERAIEHFELALEIFSEEILSESWAVTHHDLAVAYRNRGKGERHQNVEQAIEHYELALTLWTQDAFPEKWAMTQNNLGVALKERLVGDRTANIEEAIRHHELAQSVFKRETFPHDWASVMNNLGLAYRERMLGDRADNIEQAIKDHELALLEWTRDSVPEDWAKAENNLGIAYRVRMRGDQADNIEQAIKHHELALEVWARDAFPEDWAKAHGSLGSAYRDRIVGRQADNVEQAIQHHQLALEVFTSEAFPEQWAKTQNNLGNAYATRSAHHRYLEAAIQHQQLALEVYTREGFPGEWARTQHSLGLAYSDRTVGDRADNLELAITHYVLALEVYSAETFPEEWARAQHNLGLAYWNRIRGERADNLDQAAMHLQLVLRLLTLDAAPAHHLTASRNLGDLHFNERHWPEALSDFSDAIAAGDQLLASAYTEPGRKAKVGETSLLYARAAYCLLQLGRLDEALERLEAGKARLLAEAMALRDVDLAFLPEDRRGAMAKARERVRALDAEMRLPTTTPARRGNAQLGELLRVARADLNLLVDEIRAEGHDFLPTGLDLSQILGLVPEGGAVLAPVVTSAGGACFVIPSGTRAVGKEHVLPLPDLTEQAVASLLSGSEELGWVTLFDVDAEVEPEVIIDATCSRLWDLLMGPVHERLLSLGITLGASVLMIPQGGLGLLPLTAAWREEDKARRYVADDWTLTFAPSAHAMNVGRRRLFDARRSGRSLLAVADPTEDLPFASSEVEEIQAAFPPDRRIVLKGRDATQEELLRETRGQSYLHMACHGAYDWADPMGSHLLLAPAPDETEPDAFSLAEIISELNLDACRLVTLSACETGVTEIRGSPDEYVGLPAGFLQAGAPGVIASLWPVSDLSTSLLLSRFYQLHLGDDILPGPALRRAQLWLRDSTGGELDLAQLWEGVFQGSGDPEAREESEYWATHRGELPFANPYHWAAFTFTGG